MFASANLVCKAGLTVNKTTEFEKFLSQDISALKM